MILGNDLKFFGLDKWLKMGNAPDGWKIKRVDTILSVNEEPLQESKCPF